MSHADPDRPDDTDGCVRLTIWPNSGPAHAAQSREFSDLGAALAAAADAVRTRQGRPWIITAEGDILSPRWIEDHAATPGRQP